MDQLIELH